MGREVGEINSSRRCGEADGDHKASLVMENYF